MGNGAKIKTYSWSGSSGANVLDPTTGDVRGMCVVVTLVILVLLQPSVDVWRANFNGLVM